MVVTPHKLTYVTMSIDEMTWKLLFHIIYDSPELYMQKGMTYLILVENTQGLNRKISIPRCKHSFSFEIPITYSQRKNFGEELWAFPFIKWAHSILNENSLKSIKKVWENNALSCIIQENDWYIDHPSNNVSLRSFLVIFAFFTFLFVGYRYTLSVMVL